MESPTSLPDFRIEQAGEQHLPLILSFIKELAEFERLSHEVVATQELLKDALFGERPAAEVIIGYYREAPVSLALFFPNFSTFLGRRGLYLEDLYVKPEARGRGIGRAMIAHLARIAKERDCGRFEWAVLNWNQPAIKFYRRLGARALDEWTTFRVVGETLDSLASEG